jgi:hypothetical protein
MVIQNFIFVHPLVMLSTVRSAKLWKSNGFPVSYDRYLLSTFGLILLDPSWIPFGTLSKLVLVMFTKMF